MLFRTILILNNLPAITDLLSGETAIVSEYANCFIACKLTAMGLLPGTEITLVRKSVFGSTLYLKTESHAICLRKEEAQDILITRLSRETA